jgi:pimeloyl-ACP methyl ester carboxylesterase
MEDKSINSFDNVKLHYTINRTDEKNSYLVLLHGLGGNISVWNTMIPFFLSNNFSVIAIDLRGHGNSSNPDKYSDYSFSKLAKDIKLILDKEHIKKIYLVGHCLGGSIAIKFTSLYPKYINSLIIVSSAYKKPILNERSLSSLEQKREILKRFLSILVKYKPIATKKSYVDFSNMNEWIKRRDVDLFRFYLDVKGTSLKSYYFYFQRMSDFDLTKEIKKINKPTLIIHGTKDLIFSQSSAIDMSKKIENSVFYSMNTGHIPVLTDYETLEKIIVSFIKN